MRADKRLAITPVCEFFFRELVQSGLISDLCRDVWLSVLGSMHGNGNASVERCGELVCRRDLARSSLAGIEIPTAGCMRRIPPTGKAVNFL